MAQVNADPPKRKYNLYDSIGLDGKFQIQKENQPYFLDLVTQELLHFQTIPLDIQVNSELGWVAVMGNGRNTPLYQYTGAEDSLVFSLTWYADTTGKEDALTKCKWIEALGKNNGYDEKPHAVKLVFGDLFKKSKWIVTAAPYRLTLFDRSKGMMPCLCTQEITLKRILELNRSRRDILDLNT